MHAHEVVHRDHDVEHLLAGDEAVAVEVVQRERPAELLVGRPAEEGGQGHKHVLELEVKQNVF